MFEPITTERLTIRSFLAEDAAGFAARRNDPEVARFQNWTLPFPVEKAEEIVGELIEMDGPANDEWWMAIVSLSDTGEVADSFVLTKHREVKQANLVEVLSAAKPADMPSLSTK